MTYDISEVIANLCQGDKSVLASLGQVADLYRDGASLQTLIPVLTHSDSEIAGCGAWIASEVVNCGCGREIFCELSLLLDHPCADVRFWAVAAVAALVNFNDCSTTERLLLRLIDSDAGVRSLALFYWCILPDQVVESLRGNTEWPTIRTLLTGTSKDDIRSAVKSPKLLEQRIGIVGAMRNFGSDDDFVRDICLHLESEVFDILPTLPRNRRLQ